MDDEFWRIVTRQPGKPAPVNAIRWGTADKTAFCLRFNSIGPRLGSTSAAYHACDTAVSAADFIATEAFEAMIAEMTQAEAEEVLAELGVAPVGMPATVGVSQARVSGDPHLITLDGLNYDLQSVGEFTMLEIDHGLWSLQSRFVPIMSNFSGIGAVAFEIGGSTLELDSNGHVLLDGETVFLVEGTGMKFEDGSQLTRFNGRTVADLTIPGADEPLTVEWTYRNGLGAVGLTIPDQFLGRVRGLLGNFDGNRHNDIALSDGSVLRADVSTQVLHGTYADSWRLSQRESLFTYEDGRTTADYTDVSYPRNIVTVSQFSADERAAARATCDSYGVRGGPSFANCELDILAGGNWSFAAAAADVVLDSTMADDLLVDSAGTLGVNFDGSIASNLDQIRFSRDPSLGTFAGPFSGTEDARFYVPSLPPHKQASIYFDIIEMGGWPSSSGFSLQIDDRSLSPERVSDSVREGTTLHGVPYTVARYRVTLDHHLPVLSAVLRSINLSAPAGRGFGLDNIQVGLDLVEPQTFAVGAIGSESVALHNLDPNGGSGRLENRGSIDRYVTRTAPGESVLLDLGTNSRHIAWTFTDSSGVLASGVFDGVDQAIVSRSGEVTTEISAAGAAPPQEQNYRLAIQQVPAKQSFVLPLKAEPLTVTKDSLGTGSGHIENKASIDEYTFEVTEGGARVLIENLSGYVAWTLLNAEGTTITEGGSGRSRTDETLPAGTYTLRATSHNESSGAYSLRIFTPPAAQTFTIENIGKDSTAGTKIFKDAPAPGAGTMETGLSKDSYTFTPTRDAEVLLDTPGNSMLEWQLFDAQGTALTEPATFTKGNTFDVEADKTYRIDITVAAKWSHVTSTTYTFTLRESVT